MNPETPLTFADLGAPMDLVEYLAEDGITVPSAVQALTFPDAIAGKDLVAAAPTGSGKTLAFGLPLIARMTPGRPHHPSALVLSPTRELAEQIHQVLKGAARIRGMFSAAVYGGVRQNMQVNNLKRGVDVLVACPGRLEDLIDQGFVNLDEVGIVVVDEADRMSDMGFLPTVKRILDQCNKDRQTMLFSATLDGAAASLAKSHMKSPVKKQVEATDEDLSRLTHYFWNANTDNRTDLTAEIIRRAGRTIVFSRTKFGADRLAAKLTNDGVPVAAIHGGRSQQQRDRALADFHEGKTWALVATDVAARGIHVDGVTCVVHFDLPDSPTEYQHRSGRTARAGASGVVVSLVVGNQRKHARNVQKAFDLPVENTQPDIELLPQGEHPEVKVVRRERSERGDRGGRSDRGPRGPRRDDRGDRGPRSDRGDRPYRPRRDDDRPARPRRDDDRAPRSRRFEDDRGPRRFEDSDRSARPRRDDDRFERRPRRDDDRPVRARRDDDRPYRPRRDDDRPARPRRDDDRAPRSRRFEDDRGPRRFEDSDRPARPRRDDDRRPRREDSRDDRPPRGRTATGRPTKVDRYGRAAGPARSSGAKRGGPSRSSGGRPGGKSGYKPGGRSAGAPASKGARRPSN